MITVIGVRFKKAGKIYYFNPGELNIKKGDFVIVETARGIEFGECVVGIKELKEGEIVAPLKNVIRKATEEDINKAARIAQATEFIESKPEKYETKISQGGTNVSGGQKQRLSIARAIAKDPEIYIFDDSFSALDFKTDAKLRKSLKEEISESTVLIVAQRISTILNAEQIIVLDEGKMVGKGTHKELLNNCEVYKQIALSQLSKEELADE